MMGVIESPKSKIAFLRILLACGALLTLLLVIINVFRHDDRAQDMALRTAVLSVAFGVLMLLG